MNISTTVNKLQGLKRSIKVNVNKEEYISQHKKDLERYKSTVKMDGFRAGKVPESVILKNYKDRIHNAYDLKETNLKNEIFDIIFLDPPFKDQEINILIDQIKMLKIANINTLIIIHRNKKSEDNISKFLSVLDEKNYGLSKILFSKLI